jgi:hypothetical protein
LRAGEARPLLLRLLGGLVLCVTTLYCGPKGRTGNGRGREGSGLYPELAVLGFHEGNSPALVRKVGRLTALLPSFATAQAELAADGVSLDIKVVHTIALRLGAEVLTTRLRDLERYRNGLLPRGKTLRGKKVGVAVDGGRVRTRIVVRKQKGKGKNKKRRRKFRVQWREPKLLIIFEMDEQGRMKRGTRPWIDGTFQGPDECMELLALHLHRLGAAEAQSVTFLADGAPWIWDRLAWVEQRVSLRSERVLRVLDWCHAVHHISLALEALALPAAERKQWYWQLRGWLRQGAANRVTGELSLLALEKGQPPGAPVWTPIAYLENHAEAGHLRYAYFRKRGVAIGSGAIESAVRRVINLRLKGPGLQWEEANAEGMLAVRAAVLTGRWDETLRHVEEEMARDRRINWQWRSPDMPAELKAQLETGAALPEIQDRQKVTDAAA